MTINRIAIALSGNSIQSFIAEYFGRCEFFLIYEAVTGEKSIEKNPFAQTFGGAGIQSAQFLIEQNVDLVIIRNIGANASAILNAAEIHIYQTNKSMVSEALAEIREHSLTGNK